MNKYVCSLILLSAGCFRDSGDNLTSVDEQTETDDSASGSEDVTDEGSVTDGGSETDSESSEADGGGTSTGDPDTNTSGATSTSGTAETSSNTATSTSTGSSTGVGPSCPDGMAFNQDICWAVAECDPVTCSVDGDQTCVSNTETCAAYGLEPTAEQFYLEEWSEAVAQDLSDQLGFDGVDDPGCCGSFGTWNSTQNTLRAWQYGFGVGYLNMTGCLQGGLSGDDVYWPIHTCFPRE